MAGSECDRRAWAVTLGALSRPWPSRALDAVHTYRRDRFAAAMPDWTPDEQAGFAALLTRFVTTLDR